MGIGCLLVVSGVACSSDSADEATTTSTRGTSGSRAEQVVEQYIDLLDQGAYVDANALRCLQARLGSSDMADFEARVTELREGLGGQLSILTSQEHSALGGRTAVRVTLSGSVTPVDIFVEGTEDGPQVCGQAIDTATEVRRTLNLQRQHEMQSTAAVEDLVVVMPGNGFKGEGVDTPRLGPLDGDPSVVQALFQEWRNQDTGQAVGVTVIEFSDAQHAIGGQLAIEDLYVDNAMEAIEVAGPAARACRHLGSLITFVQPPDVGPLRDAATLRYGSLLLVVTVVPAERGAEPTTLVEAVRRLDQRAWAA